MNKLIQFQKDKLPGIKSSLNNNESWKILMVDDKSDFINTVRDMLVGFIHRNKSIELLGATNENAAKTLLSENQDISVVILDLVMENKDSGKRIYKYIRNNLQNNDIQIIFLTGETRTISEREIIEECLLDDFILKIECHTDRIKTSIATRLDNYIRLSNKNENLAELNNKIILFKTKLRENILYKMGYSDTIIELINFIEKVAETNENIHLHGETGVGKELVAKYIHNFSNRCNNHFIEVHCGAIPSELFESELFGYEKGAFTDAKNTKIGYFEQAQNGTLFLDEIDKMPIAQQIKLLKVIETKKIYRIGGEKAIDLNFRLVTAGSSDLLSNVDSGMFHKELYYRLTIKRTIPSLENRRQDLPHLAFQLLEKKSKEMGKYINNISESAINKLLSHTWTGNVRELENVISLAIILADTTTITDREIIIDIDQITKNELHNSALLENDTYTISEFELAFQKLVENYLIKNITLWKEKSGDNINALIRKSYCNKLILNTTYKLTNYNKSLTAKLLGMTGNEQEIRDL